MINLEEIHEYLTLASIDLESHPRILSVYFLKSTTQKSDDKIYAKNCSQVQPQ